ncbi:MAG TPA: hypothetical protein VIQ81_12165 [Gammaproteobacteria bacterium]
MFKNVFIMLPAIVSPMVVIPVNLLFVGVVFFMLDKGDAGGSFSAITVGLMHGVVAVPFAYLGMLLVGIPLHIILQKWFKVRWVYIALLPTLAAFVGLLITDSAYNAIWFSLNILAVSSVYFWMSRHRQN